MDRTEITVRNMLKAIKAPLYDIDVLSNRGMLPGLDSIAAEDVLKRLSLLKYRNVRGSHIYVRPSGEHRYTVLDDLNETMLTRLVADGFNLCAIVETSVGNFQAWLKHRSVFPKLLGTFAAQTLAERYDADPSAADWRRFGRLPGFTNCKPKYDQQRLPVLADYPNLPYTEQVFAESMRLYPPAWAMGRMSIKPVTLGPYRIPPGAHSFFSQYIMGRDLQYFSDPLRFAPTRFTPENKASRPRFTYFPFGAGNRQCIGESFAWMEGVFSIATIAQRPSGWALVLTGTVLFLLSLLGTPSQFLPKPSYISDAFPIASICSINSFTFAYSMYGKHTSSISANCSIWKIGAEPLEPNRFLYELGSHHCSDVGTLSS